jgi:predicted nuclease of restriction endonuclease-like RecB superfamily
MAFKLSEFKKTTRKEALYPHRIKDERYTAAISYAIGYYEQMLGRARAEFEAEALLEFFGDPRLARGIVACLGRTYAWRAPRFDEIFGQEAARQLWRAGLATPAALRARLYGLANGRYGGVIQRAERQEALALLCAELPIGPRELEQGLYLDAEERQLLVKLGPTPAPDEIVARYNYHSLETALCHAELLRLHFAGPIWAIVRSAHNLARRYRVRYELCQPPGSLFDRELELGLRGGRDAFGSYTRLGRRLVRVLLRLLASHPDSLIGGEALVHLRGQKLRLSLEGWPLEVLGVAARQSAEAAEAWEEDSVELFRRAWGRAVSGGHTDGWRLRRDPEPLVGPGAVVVPDFGLRRGDTRLSLCLAESKGVAEPLLRDLGRLGSRERALLITPGHVAESLGACPVPLATYDAHPDEAIPQLLALLQQAA